MHRITNNWSLKLISLTLAILLWSHVRGEVNPLETLSVDVPLTKVPPRDVMLLNKRAVPDTVTVMLSGPRLALRNLKGGGLTNPLDNAETPTVLRSGTIHAWLDFSRARLGGDESDVPVKALSRDADIAVVAVKPGTITVSLDRAQSIRLPVKMQLTAPLPPGLAVVAAHPNPKIVRVFGPSNLLERIASVRVRVPAKTLVAGPASTNNFSGTTLVALGRDGEEITGAHISPATCNVGIEVKETEVRREIKIEAAATGRPAAGHSAGALTVTPSSIAVVATNSVFKRARNLKATIDIAGADRTIRRRERLVLPPGMRPVGAERPFVTVTATIINGSGVLEPSPNGNARTETETPDEGQPPVRSEQ